MNITFLAPAEAELLDAVAYYNSQSEGPGYEFAAEVRRTIERIVQEAVRAHRAVAFKAEVSGENAT